jgi:hypothetical protein
VRIVPVILQYVHVVVIGITYPQVVRRKDLRNERKGVPAVQVVLQVVVPYLHVRTVRAAQPQTVHEQEHPVQVIGRRGTLNFLHQKARLELDIAADRKYRTRRKKKMYVMERQRKVLTLKQSLPDKIVRTEARIEPAAVPEGPEVHVRRQHRHTAIRYVRVVRIVVAEHVTVYHVVRKTAAGPQTEKRFVARLDPVGIRQKRRRRTCRTYLVGKKRCAETHLALVRAQIGRNRERARSTGKIHPLAAVRALDIPLVLVARIRGVDVQPVEYVLAELRKLLARGRYSTQQDKACCNKNVKNLFHHFSVYLISSVLCRSQGQRPPYVFRDKHRPATCFLSGTSPWGPFRPHKTARIKFQITIMT